MTDTYQYQWQSNDPTVAEAFKHTYQDIGTVLPTPTLYLKHTRGVQTKPQAANWGSKLRSLGPCMSGHLQSSFSLCTAPRTVLSNTRLALHACIITSWLGRLLLCIFKPGPWALAHPTSPQRFCMAHLCSWQKHHQNTWAAGPCWTEFRNPLLAFPNPKHPGFPAVATVIV